MFRVLFAFTASLLLLTASAAHAQTKFKNAVPANEVQTVFNDYTSNGYRPVNAVASVSNGVVTYDLAFAKNDGKAYEMRHMIPDADWAQKDADLRDLGYSRICSNHFTVNGKKYHCTIWVK